MATTVNGNYRQKIVSVGMLIDSTNVCFVFSLLATSNGVPLDGILTMHDLRQRVFSETPSPDTYSVPASILANVSCTITTLQEHAVSTMNLKDKEAARCGIMATFLVYCIWQQI